MRCNVVLTALSLLVSSVVGPVFAAEDTALKRLSSLDESKKWRAVGRINVGNTGFCTGALIGPDLVLTAAHCLFNAETGERADDASIEFLAGWRDGRAAAYRGARRSTIHADYVYQGRENAQNAALDLALIQLDQPIRHPSIRPFETARTVRTGQEVQVVSYAKTRSEAPSLQEVCRVLTTDPGVYVTSCDVDFGASGAPVFVQEDGKTRIMSVVSAKAEWRTQKVALTVGVEDRVAGLINQLQGGDAVLNSGERAGGSGSIEAGAKPRLLKIGGKKQPSGALFVKP